VLTQVRLLRDLDLGALRQQHPDRNLQSLPRWVHDTDRPIFALRSAKDLQGSTLKRMKGVEDLNMIRAQGIVGVGATIRTPISLSPAAASHLWTPPSTQGKTYDLAWRVVGCCHLSGL
jgi:hypothetical protein